MIDTRKIAVLIVDDSAVMRQVARERLESDPGIEVIGVAADPLFAMERMKQRWPDVLVLDIEMPRMDGLTFLQKLMSEHPTPVVICSTLTDKGAETTFRALAAGAVACIAKPKSGLRQFIEDSSNDLVSAVKAAAKANLRSCAANASATPRLAVPPPALGALPVTTERVVAIGTSTGGTKALEYVLTRLPARCPGIVIVQHMPESFTALFAKRLDGLSALEVLEARDGDRVLPGRALVAPGGRHMSLVRSGAQYLVQVRDGPLVNRHKPSVDVLFRSVARYAGRNALGIIMTGMGDDGARGLLEMREAGAPTIAEDESTCVVFGMPMEAIRMGAADKVLPLDSIPQAIANAG